MNNQVIRYDNTQQIQPRNATANPAQIIANKQVKRVDINFNLNNVNNATKGALHNLNRSNIQEWFKKNNPNARDEVVCYCNKFFRKKKSQWILGSVP